MKLLFTFGSRSFLSFGWLWELQRLRHIVNWVWEELFFSNSEQVFRIWCTSEITSRKFNHFLYYFNSIELLDSIFKANLKVQSHSISFSDIQIFGKDGTEMGRRDSEEKEISCQKVKYFFIPTPRRLLGRKSNSMKMSVWPLPLAIVSYLSTKERDCPAACCTCI